jgi:hypothetical protein
MSATWNDSLVDPPEGAGIGPTDQVEDYLAGLPEAPRVALEKLGKTIKAAALGDRDDQLPDAALQARWTVPRVLRSVQELTTDNPLSSALVKKIMKARIQEHTAPPRR